jgi:hypothetical protein
VLALHSGFKTVEAMSAKVEIAVVAAIGCHPCDEETVDDRGDP